MIPVQLTIKGLYSYARSVTIDFEPLVAARLFGIFGPVGSGKSAILEAIMFVLFDRSNRLNKAGDDRYYNMMNLQSNEMSIDFIFRGGRNHKNKFRFYFSALRSSRDFQKVAVKDRSYYQWLKSDWKPLKKPDVLGMTYENFMQTVIIPQGKFREFIDQKPADRTRMFKELFQLDRFDIAGSAFQKLAEVKEQYSYLDGQLSQFEEINKTILRQLIKEISGLESEIEKQSKSESKLVLETDQLQVLEHIHHELLEITGTVNTLESEDEFYQQKQHHLNRFLRISQLFRDRVLRQVELLDQAKSAKCDLQQAIETTDRLTREVKNSRQKWEQAQADYQSKEQLKHQTEDLKLLIRLKDLRTELSYSTATHDQTATRLRDLDNKINLLESAIDKARKLASARAEAVKELQELTVLKNWWNICLEKEKPLEILQSEMAGINQELNSLKIEKTRLISGLLDQKKLKSEINRSRQQLQLLMVREDWQTHARHLKEGKPCPLCGSIEHPNPLSSAGLESEIETVSHRLKRLEESNEKQLLMLQQSGILTTKIEDRKQGLKNLEKKYQLGTGDLNKHRENYPGAKKPGKYPEDLNERINNLKYLVESSEKEISQLNNNQEELKKLAQTRTPILGKLQGILSVKENLHGKIDQISTMIRSLDIHELLQKPRAELETLKLQLNARLDSIDVNYKRTLDLLVLNEQQLNQQKGLLQSLETQVAQIKAQSDKIETSLLEDCRKESLKGVKEVQNILALGLDVEQERRELEKYLADLNAARHRQKALQKKMGNKKYHAARHHQLKQDLEDLKIELRQLNHQLSGKKLTYEQYQTRLQKKDSLMKELKDLSLRKAHIQEICNLLRGNGFINFISSVYLQNLCKAANTRFTRLTGNSLSLELNRQNEFMVRDHLNDGKLRLLKTLSGGQIFQASLSLALSLAENVKNLNQADQSFFFLDEGFGSLDRVSLQLVFETLKMLQKENRIVGIISHLEDLQLEIDTYLTVKQDQQQGSIISCSWEE